MDNDKPEIKYNTVLNEIYIGTTKFTYIIDNDNNVSVSVENNVSVSFTDIPMVTHRLKKLIDPNIPIPIKAKGHIKNIIDKIVQIITNELLKKRGY